MKLPSIDLLLRQAKETLFRFPLVLLSALIGTYSMMRVIGFSRDYYMLHSQVWFNIVMTCSLGIPLFLAFALYSEKRGHSTAKKLLLQAVPLLILLVFYFSLSKEDNYTDIGRYFLYLTTFHLFVSFSPFVTGDKDQIRFWDFNQKIFLRFVLSALYSVVLYAGLAIALLAFDKLFDMNIKGERYGQLFFFIAGVFNTWFFCSGIPAIGGKQESEFKYPKGLKIFAQYVILPIVVVYVVILYMYLFKIIFQWNLPMGWVSYLVLGFSAAGIFSLLLVYPQKDEVRWLRIFSRLFFAALIPQIILLFLAISRRTSEYGMTEKRYYVIVLAIWLAVTTIYYLLTNFRNIKYIPVSLALIAVITSAGPWSSFDLSINSQISRLEEVLIKNSLLVNGKIVKAKEEINKEELSDVKSIIEFLIQRRKLERIQPWFDADLNTVTSEKNQNRVKTRNSYQQQQGIIELMGLDIVNKESFKKKPHIDVRTKNTNEIDVKGYDRFIFYDTYSGDTVKKVFGDSASKTEIYFDRDMNLLSVRRDSDSLRFDFKQPLERLESETPELEEMTLNAVENGINAKFIVKYIYAERKNDSLRINNLQGYLLIKNE